MAAWIWPCPCKGRLLTEADDRLRSGHPVLVLGYGFWIDLLGMQSRIVRRDVRIVRSVVDGSFQREDLRRRGFGL